MSIDALVEQCMWYNSVIDMLDNCYSKESDAHCSWYNESKIIVNESALDSLLHVCRVCSGMCTLSKERQGAYLQIEASCMECGHTFTFQSTPKIGRYGDEYIEELHFINRTMQLVW